MECMQLLLSRIFPVWLGVAPDHVRSRPHDFREVFYELPVHATGPEELPHLRQVLETLVNPDGVNSSLGHR